MTLMFIPPSHIPIFRVQYYILVEANISNHEKDLDRVGRAPSCQTALDGRHNTWSQPALFSTCYADVGSTLLTAPASTETRSTM